VKAKAYFNLAFNNQFNFDIAESSAKLNEFAQMALVTLSQNPQYKQEFIDSIVQESIEWSEYAVKLSHATDPIVLQRLGSILLQKAFFEKKEIYLNQAIGYLEQAVDLAPKRIEARVSLAQAVIFKGQTDYAVRLMQKNLLSDPKNPELLWQSSIVARQANNIEPALIWSEQALIGGFMPISFEQVRWMSEEYVKQKNLEKAIGLYESFFQKGELTIQDRQVLAGLYRQIGKTDLATQIENSLKKLFKD
jgi:tetratricopeptide (TPR) repeat protein